MVSKFNLSIIIQEASVFLNVLRTEDSVILILMEHRCKLKYLRINMMLQLLQ